LSLKEDKKRLLDDYDLMKLDKQRLLNDYDLMKLDKQRLLDDYDLMKLDKQRLLEERDNLEERRLVDIANSTKLNNFRMKESLTENSKLKSALIEKSKIIRDAQSAETEHALIKAERDEYKLLGSVAEIKQGQEALARKNQELQNRVHQLEVYNQGLGSESGHLRDENAYIRTQLETLISFSANSEFSRKAR
jgi:hypothetical protein